MNQAADCIRLTSEFRTAVTLSFCPTIWWESGPQIEYINLHLVPQIITKTFNNYEDAAGHTGGHTHTENYKVRLQDLNTRTSYVRFPDRNIKTWGFLWVTSCGDGQI
jgi:hypothetical protein